MVWNELKKFILSQEGKNEDEVIETIFKFQKILTPKKCLSYISHLKKVLLKKKFDSKQN